MGAVITPICKQGTANIHTNKANTETKDLSGMNKDLFTKLKDMLCYRFEQQGVKNTTAHVPVPTPIHAACLATSSGLVTCSKSRDCFMTLP